MKRLLCILSVCAGFVSTAAVPSGYVTEGLTAYWDAIDNQGTGTHDASATTWVDLVGGQAFQLTGTTWGGDVGKYLQFAGTKSSYGTLTGEDALALFDYTTDSTDRTIELVFKYDSATTDGVLLEAQTHSNVGIGRWHGGSRVIYGISSDLTELKEPGVEFYTISAHYKSGWIQKGSTYQNNEEVALTRGANYWGSANGTTITLGKVTTANSYLFAGKLYAIRVYNRALTAEEATKNYNADQQRFNRESAATVVSGSVTVGETTYGAGETIKTDPATTALTVDSATDAVLSLADRITALALTAGTAKLADTASGELTRLTDLTLGAAATLQLPADGLQVTGAITAESGATVKGPGTLIGAAAECPVTLTDGAQYVSSTAASFTWPSSGTAYIPVDVTADITASDVAKVEGLDKVVFLGATSKVTYKLATAWTMNVPLEGPGRFEFWSAGDITLAADNKNLTGCFFFTNTTVLVTHESGLGTVRSQTCDFWPGEFSTSTTSPLYYGHTIDFDNGKSVFTNSAAITVYPDPGTDRIAFGSVSIDKTLVQAGDFYIRRLIAGQYHVSRCLKNNVTFLGTFGFIPNGSAYLYSSADGNGEIWMWGPLDLRTSYWLNRLTVHLGCSKTLFTSTAAVYSDSCIICERENVISAFMICPYQAGSMLDLNGYNQDMRYTQTWPGGVGKTTGTPLFKVRSAKPASLRMTGNYSRDVNLTFSGAAGFTKAGTGTYGLYNQSGESVNDTTGELKVEAGTLLLTDNYKWSGTNVTVTGGALQIAVQAAVSSDKAHLVVSGGTLSLQKGATMIVGYATFGATNLLDDTYTMAALKAIPEVAPFIGADADDAATITVQKPAEFEWEGWPDVPTDVVKVPGGKTVYVGSDETNKIAVNARSINLGVNAKVIYTNMPNAAITLAMPISGKGTFAFEDCGTVTITADNSGLVAPGAFSFTRTDVVVAHRYGLGDADTGSCSFLMTGATKAYGMKFTGEAKTNDVAVAFTQAANQHSFFGYDDANVEFFQNGDFTQVGGNTTSSRVTFLNQIAFGGVTTLQFVNNATAMRFRETSKLCKGGGSNPWLFGTGGTIWFDAPNPADTLRSLIFQFGSKVHLNAPYAFNLNDLSCYPGVTTFDLHGNDQSISYISYLNEVASDWSPIVFTSAEPATLYMPGAQTDGWRAFKLTGAMSLDYSGTKKQSMGNGANETTGSLIVRSGSFEMKNGSYWEGTNVTVVGGTLIIAANCRTDATTGAGKAFGRRTNLAIAETGATLELGAGRTDSVRSLKVGDAFVAAGVYGGPASSAPNKLDCLAGTGLLRVRNSSDNPGLMLLVR